MTAVVYGFLLKLAMAAGLAGLLLRVLITLSLFRYGYTVLRHVANGWTNFPPPDIESTNPVGQFTVVMHSVLFGTLLFIVVAVGVVAAAYFTLAGDDGSSKRGTSTTAALATTTVAPPFSATYKATTGLNVRQGPGTNVPTVGVVETGRDVTVACVVEGELVNAPSGPNSQWLKITGPGPVGYVSSAFVAVGDDLRSQKIPTCPAA